LTSFRGLSPNIFFPPFLRQSLPAYFTIRSFLFA
jgi:hypothetical protein